MGLNLCCLTHTLVEIPLCAPAVYSEPGWCPAQSPALDAFSYSMYIIYANLASYNCRFTVRGVIVDNRKRIAFHTQFLVSLAEMHT